MPGGSAPRHNRPRGRAMYPTWGRFVRAGDLVRLYDRAGNYWSLESVTICMGGFGFEADGVAKLPRAEVVNPTTGQVLVQGDRVIIDFLDGSPRRPFVRGGIRSVQSDDFLPHNHDAPGADSNRATMRLASITDAGVEQARVELEAHAEPGRVDVTASKGGSSLRVRLTEALLTVGNAVQFVALATNVTARLNALETAFNAHTHVYNPGPSAPIPTATPLPQATATTTSDVAATKLKSE